MRHIQLTVSDTIAILTLNNAEGKMNVVSSTWLDEMTSVIAEVKNNGAVSGLIIVSGKETFMAGADLKWLVESYGKLTMREAYEFSQRATRMHRDLETMGKPVVAALNGLCLGGGYELALACHHRILLNEAKAIVGLPEVTVGLLPGSGGTQRLSRLIGVKAALEVLLTGRSFKPTEALKMKLVDRLETAGNLVQSAKAWLASNPDPSQPWDRKGFSIPESRGMVSPDVAAMYTATVASVVGRFGYHQPAPIAILSAVFEGTQLPFDRGLSVESKYFARLLTDPVARNLIRTGYLSKQAADKGVRRPAGFVRTTVTKIGVLGAGMMGAGIALVAAMAGIDVVLIDRDLPTAQKGHGYSIETLGKAVKKGATTQSMADDIAARIVATDDYSQLSQVDLVIEAVFEDIAVKAEVTRRAEAMMPANAILATNTSTLPITQLAEASARPEQFIGLHFFSPVDRMQLVEVIKGRKTTQETLARALDFIAQIGKTPIVVNDSRGFYTSRVFQTLINEGAAMLAEGVEPSRIENAAKAIGFPVGPLALLDEVTLDLPIQIVEQAIEQVGATFVVPAGMPALYRMRELGRTGRKSGGGFYDYPEGGRKHLWKGLAGAFPVKTLQPSQNELKNRLLYVQSLETSRCLEEHVLETPQDADVGAVLGWGFPSWTGGPLSYLDTIGLQEVIREADRMSGLYGPRFAPSPWLRAKASRGEHFYAPSDADEVAIR